MSGKRAFGALYLRFLGGYAALAGTRRAKEFDSRVRFGRRLDLNRPKTLADKICWLELNNYRSNPLVIQCTSKADVRKYLKSKGLQTYLVPLVCEPWRNTSEIDIESLPNAFAMKAAHGCGMNRLVQNKSVENLKELRTLAERWLSKNYARACVEPHYLGVGHAIICEELLAAPEDMIDYKIHCMNGTARLIQTCSERCSKLKEGLYDTEWHPVSGLKDIEIKQALRPNNLALMIELAQVVAQDFPYVRVDFYEVKEKVFFGELTFTPATGVLPHFSDALVEKCGSFLELDI
ncbi:hypothetical protein BN3658_02033 [Coriobacteriaceae bacterium CHKCI002]|nr:hypothetical protein BN3658_02033 [Coriobacteriaceae bacterium CHKCI002]